MAQCPNSSIHEGVIRLNEMMRVNWRVLCSYDMKMKNQWARACFRASVVLVSCLVSAVLQHFHESDCSRQEGVWEGGVWG